MRAARLMPLYPMEKNSFLTVRRLRGIGGINMGINIRAATLTHCSSSENSLQPMLEVCGGKQNQNNG